MVEIAEQGNSLIASKLEKLRVIHVGQKTVNVFSGCQEINEETRRQRMNDQNESEGLDTGGKVDIGCPKSASGGWYRG